MMYAADIKPCSAMSPAKASERSPIKNLNGRLAMTRCSVIWYAAISSGVGASGAEHVHDLLVLRRLFESLKLPWIQCSVHRTAYPCVATTFQIDQGHLIVR